MINVEINTNKTKLTGDTTRLRELFEHLQFRHPNAFFIQKKLKRKWDGMVTPLTPAGTLDTGLLDKAIQFLVDKGETQFNIKDHRNIPNFKEEFIDVIKDKTLRGYQAESIRLLRDNKAGGFIPNPRGIFQLSMNAGKTLIAMALYENIVDARVLILVSSSVLYKQMKEDLAEVYPKEYGFMQGKSIQWGDIMVCMIPTLKNRLVEYRRELKEYNVLLVDECDLAANKTAEAIYKNLWHIPIRVGLTGTAYIRELKKDAIRNLEMRKLFGDALIEVTMKDLEDMGVSTPVEISIYEGNKKTGASTNFIEEFHENITYNKRRTKKLIRLIKKEIRTGYLPILLVNRFVDQCELVHEEVTKAFPNLNIGIIHTNTSIHDKNKVIRDFKSGEVQILVANRLIKRGMNFPLIQCVINNAAGEHPSTPLQIMGRGSRTSSTKDKFHFIDFFDQGRYLRKQSRGRIIQYKRQKLKIVRGSKLK